MLKMSLAFSLTLTQSVEKLHRWTSQGVKFTNTSGSPSTTPSRVKWISSWSSTLEILWRISKRILKENQQHQPGTTSLIHPKMRSSYFNPTHIFSPCCGTDTVPVKARATRHTIFSLISLYYSDTAWCWLLQETGQGVKYTQGTIGLPLIILMETSVNIERYDDAASVVH